MVTSTARAFSFSMQPSSTRCRLSIKRFSTSSVSMLDQTRGVLPKIPSQIAKFHLPIVENRLKFQSKILPFHPGVGARLREGVQPAVEVLELLLARDFLAAGNELRKLLVTNMSHLVGLNRIKSD